MLQNRKPQGLSQVTVYIRALTALGYIIMGIYVIKRQWLLVPLSVNVSYAMGILVVLYGCFRGWTAYHAFKNQN
ncbi:hypothetical protein Emtol_3609 [Emticicia oligotrophica DSM 17448]|uniref:DUF202 domain-containing protein n=1 Tax=Emticicia oligotrophica (strain DSM 17448 / CIP 109782 / MTCC 6937 / GPTSA100-15) TaxID=929562 RepID=A0ABM5N5S3_EMTOG|nr:MULTISPECIES: hypothetical protein [Emticicia]AFK04735.1 hypothetical protein Emtol_3609 [Emticicia oligotrophica DSM 17448]